MNRRRGSSGVEPTRLRLAPWLTVDAFEYAVEDGRLATLVLSATVRRGILAPSRPELRVRWASKLSAHQPIRASLLRTAMIDSPVMLAHEQWLLQFRLPLVVVEHPSAAFELGSVGRQPLTLPEPVAMAAGDQTPAILFGALPTFAQLRDHGRRATAVASVLALGAGLGSAAAVANADTVSLQSTISTAITTITTTIDGPTTPAQTTTTTTTTTTTGTSTAPPVQTQTSTAPSTPPTTSTGPTTTPSTVTSTTPGQPSSGSTTGTQTHGRSAGSILRSGAAAGSGALVISGAPGNHHHVQRCVVVAHDRRERGRHGRAASAAARASKSERARRDTKHSNCTTVGSRSGAGTRAGRHDGGVAIHRTAPKPRAAQSAVTWTPLVGGVSTAPWGTPFSTTVPMSQLDFYAKLVAHANMPPRYLLPIYRAAGRHFHVPWQLLAAINREETNYGTDLGNSSAGAEGWMQFEPATWREWGMAVNRRLKPVAGLANPYNPGDAIFSAARYLHDSGGTHNVPRAVFAYNHAAWYVVQVLSIAEQINTHGLRWNSSAHRKIAVMRTTARLLDGMTYTWGGGHSNWLVSVGYDCSGFVSAVLHSVGFLRAPATTQTLPLERGIFPGRGRMVTIYDRTDGGSLDADHVIMDIRGEWWESGGSSAFGGGAGVHRIRAGSLSRAYLASFNLVLHPWGL